MLNVALWPPKATSGTGKAGQSREPSEDLGTPNFLLSVLPLKHTHTNEPEKEPYREVQVEIPLVWNFIPMETIRGLTCAGSRSSCCENLILKLCLPSVP